MGLVQYDLCRICLDEKETVRYIPCDCMRLERPRFYHIGQTNPEPADSQYLSTSHLINQLKEAE